MNPTITRHPATRSITVEKTIAAPRHDVWAAWTTPASHDQWWAPQPWSAVTKDFSFVPGGRWLYHMAGPNGEKAWSLFDYKEIAPESHFTASDAFCDEHAAISPDLPTADWRVEFEDVGTDTKLIVTITFPTEQAMSKLIEMGFEQGFTMGLENLDQTLAAQVR